jgi:hypothetical protein
MHQHYIVTFQIALRKQLRIWHKAVQNACGTAAPKNQKARRPRALLRAIDAG